MTPTRKETMSIKIMMLIRSDVCDVRLFVSLFISSIWALFKQLVSLVYDLPHHFVLSYNLIFIFYRVK